MEKPFTSNTISRSLLWGGWFNALKNRVQIVWCGLIIKIVGKKKNSGTNNKNDFWPWWLSTNDDNNLKWLGNFTCLSRLPKVMKGDPFKAEMWSDWRVHASRVIGHVSGIWLSNFCVWKWRVWATWLPDYHSRALFIITCHNFHSYGHCNFIGRPINCRLKFQVQP